MSLLNHATEQTEESGTKVPSTVLPGLYLKPAWLFQAKLPKVRDILRELHVK